MTKPLQTHHVSVHLRNKAIVRDITWHAERGKINAIVGPNGAGKSTFLKAVMGILPHQGQTRLDGQPRDSYPRKERARRLAWVPQRSDMQLSVRVASLVAQGRFPHLGPSGKLSTHDKEVIEQALCDVQCQHLIHRRWNTLSGGERRRVMIARGLATGAKILLLDEPTASLDIEHALRLMELLRRLAAQDYTLVPVLHDLNLTQRYADNILVLNQGAAAAYGPAHSVLDAELIAKVYHVNMTAKASTQYSLREEA